MSNDNPITDFAYGSGNRDDKARIAVATGIKDVVTVDLLEVAADDPCMPIRNLAGHIVSCNYGDWIDFSKCKCAEGLLTAPEKATAFVVAPMPLRDILASSVQVSDEMAHELAMGIRAAQKANQKIETVGEAFGVTNDPPLTVIELADARAKIRYLEADAMISWRVQSLKIQAEAEAAAKAELAGDKAAATPICVCGHSVIQHDMDELGTCTLSGCGCKSYTSRPGAPRIVAPVNSGG